MSRWWEYDMSDNSQGMFSDPNLAIQLATLPAQYLAAQQQSEEEARVKRGGFLKQTMSLLGSGLKDADGALSNVPGWGVAKEATKASWYPVDKAASGAYWLYSNGVSQPLSTLMLMSGTAQGSKINSTSYFSASDWANTWHKANKISPGQAAANLANVDNAMGGDGKTSNPFLDAVYNVDDIFSGNIVNRGIDKLLGTGASQLTSEQKAQVARQADRFVYDNDFWRDKSGWKYTAGTGSLDFMTSMGLDPTVAGLKYTSGAVKGARSIKIATDAAEATKAATPTKSVSGLNILAEKAAEKTGNLFAKTPYDASKSKQVQNFFDWTEGKGAAEIAAHPIWGTGRKVNPARHQLSQLLSQADDVEKPLIMRMAMGDNDAMIQLGQKNSDLLAQIGRMSDNRVLVDEAKYDPAIMSHFLQDANTRGAYAGNQLVEPLYPRPLTPGPRRDGWDATYGKLAKSAETQQKAADALKSGKYGVRQIQIGTNVSPFDGLRFLQWKSDQLDLLSQQIAATKIKDTFYSPILGDNWHKSIDEFSPADNNLFGTLSSLYRTGPLAFTNSERAADKSITAATVDRQGRKAAGGFATRTIRQGYYSVPLRVIQSFGDRLPTTLINHNDTDASDRVLDMLKRVPGLGQETRLGMLNQYAGAPDKITRSNVLTQINKQVIAHMASRYNLDEEIAGTVANMIKAGTDDAMQSLTGRGKRGSTQMFSAADNTETGARADKFEDGEGIAVAPLAKTQLAYSEPLLDVAEVDRFLSRHSGYLSGIRQMGGTAKDAVTGVADSLSNVWKATTLLRPGYMLRAPSDEMAASAIKFGLIASIADSAHGGANWIRNRGHQLTAYTGKGSYTSTVSGKSVVRVVDPAIKDIADRRELKATRINVGKAYPIVMQRIDGEMDKIKPLQRRLDKINAMKNPTQDHLDEANDLMDDIADHKQVIDEHRMYADAIVEEGVKAQGIRLGEGFIEHNGFKIPQAFSREWDESMIPRDQITSDMGWQAAYGRGENIDVGRMIKTGNWVGVKPGEVNHMSSWLDAINKQFRQDELFRLVAGDDTLKTARSWLKTQPGKDHLSLLGVPGRDPGRLLQGIKDTLDAYLPTTQLRAKLANNEIIKESELHANIAKGDFPVVHGEEVLGLTANGRKKTTSQRIDDLLANGFRQLGSIPTDVLSRQPTYLRAQGARMRQLIDQEVSFQKNAGKAGDTIEPAQLNAMLQKSDKMARSDISQVVFDPQRTTATQALRFIAPFMAAHVDGLERWAGLIAEKPELIGTASKIYNAPVAANLVTDQYGNHVDQSGYAMIDDGTGKKVRTFVPIQNRTIHMKVPPGTKGLVSKLTGTGGSEVPIKIQSLNTILPGDPWWNPGTGPLVQVPASQLAKKEPAMGDFLQWAKVLPYGPTAGGLGTQFMDAFTPKYISEAFTAFNPNSEKFQQTMLQEYQRQVAEYHKGGPAPDMNKAEANAKKFYFLKAFTSWMTPAQTQSTPLTGTPYQFYVDQYKKLQQVDPKTADEEFLNKYGEDYFVFSSSLSKSMGIAPTLSALKTAKEYKNLIAGDPSLAGFIVGDVYNQGEFSPSAYAAEKDMTIGGQKIRTTQSVQDAIAENQANEGWVVYNKLMHSIDSALFRSGFTSYGQAGAENFQAYKQNLTKQIAQLYPSWYDSFSVQNRNLIPSRIQSFEKLVSDPKLANDPMRQDIPSLQVYLLMRQQYKAALTARGASQLSFADVGEPDADGNFVGGAIGENADIGKMWRNFQSTMVMQNTKFADVFHRYLESDDLQ